jgi:hypothetical protein
MRIISVDRITSIIEKLFHLFIAYDRKTSAVSWKWIALAPLLFPAIHVSMVTSSYIPYSDDLMFAGLRQNSSLIGMLSHRYMVWSGRVIPDGIMYCLAGAGVTIWKVLNPLFAAIFSFGMLRLIMGKKINELGMLRLGFLSIMAASFVFILHRDVKRETLYWMTGSVFYLWPVTAGLYALIPIRDYLQQQSAKTFTLTMALLCTIVISFGQEQSALFFLAVLLFFACCQLIKYRRLHPGFVVQIILALAIVALLLCAPGNRVRFHEEELARYPGFTQVPVMEKIHLGLGWLIEHFVKREKKLFILLWISSALYLMRFARCGYLKIAAVLPLAGILLFLAAKSNLVSPAYTMLADFKSGGVLSWIVWIILFGSVPLSLLSACSPCRGVSFPLLFLGSILSASFMFFSPTVYASSLRPFFVMDVGLFILSLILLYCSACRIEGDIPA